MHEMEKTPKIITIIGLVLEGVVTFVVGAASILMLNINKISGLGSAIEADLSNSEYEDLMNMMDFIGYFLLALAVIYGIFFTINFILFRGLMTGKYTEEKAKKIYLYQAIWGGLNLLSNQITGILYLVSGIQGYNGRKDTVKVRDGI